MDLQRVIYEAPYINKCMKPIFTHHLNYGGKFCIVLYRVLAMCQSNNISFFVVISHMLVGSKMVLINFAITFLEPKKTVSLLVSVYLYKQRKHTVCHIKTFNTLIYNFKHTHLNYFAKMRQLQMKVFGEMRGIIKW